MEGPGFATFRGQGGEEIDRRRGVLAPDGAGTRVTASSYLFDMQIGRFFLDAQRGWTRVSAPFVTGPRSRPGIIRLVADGAPAITIRVEMPAVVGRVVVDCRLAE